MNVKDVFKKYRYVFVIIGFVAIVWLLYSIFWSGSDAPVQTATKNVMATDTGAAATAKGSTKKSRAKARGQGDQSRLPPAKVFDADGKPYQVSTFKGNVILVNLWATWCAPCVKELPSLARLQQKIGRKDFFVVPISMDRKGSNFVEAFLKARKLSSLKTLYDRDRNVSKSWEYDGIPVSFLIDRDGRLIKTFNGDHQWDEGQNFNQIVNVLKQ